MSALHDLMSYPPAERESRGYAFTASEIASQPATWRKTLAIVEAVEADVKRFIGATDRFLFTGAGSSYYAAAGIAPVVRLTARVAEAIPSTEILMDPESALPREEFVLVSLARSGDSPEGNAVVELAERLRPEHVKHLVITCNREGELARLAGSSVRRGHTLFLPEESNDRSLAMTSSFSSLTIAGCRLGFLDERGSYHAAVEGLARAASKLLDAGSDLASGLAAEGFSRVFFLGSRPFLGGALEAHLKVQELSGGAVVANAEDTLGFRHGFMAAVDRSSLVVLALSRDPNRRLYEEDLLAEIREKGIGRKTVVIGDGSSLSPSLALLTDAVFDYGPVNDVPDGMLSPLVAIPGQLLGLFVSLVGGLRPDNPSPRGVINRVVQGVTIHPLGA